MILAFVWMPACTGSMHAPPCEWEITADGARNSIVKYKHITLWAAFFVMTWLQVRHRRHPLLIAAAAAVAVGVLIELEERATGTGYCHPSDRLPTRSGR